MSAIMSDRMTKKSAPFPGIGKGRAIHVALLALCLGLSVVVPTVRSHAGDEVRVTGVRTESGEGGVTRVIIENSAGATFTTWTLDRPSRVVVEMAGARLSASSDPIDVGSFAVGNVQATATANGTRVVVSLRRRADYRIVPEGKSTVLYVEPWEKPVVAPVAVPAKDPNGAAQLQQALQQAQAAKAALQLAESRAAQAESDSHRLAAATSRLADENAQLQKRQVAAEAAQSAAERLSAELSVRGEVTSQKDRKALEKQRQEADRARETATIALEKLARENASLQARRAEAELAREAATKAAVDLRSERDAADRARSDAENARRQAVAAEVRAQSILTTAQAAQAKAEELAQSATRAQAEQAEAKVRQARIETESARQQAASATKALAGVQSEWKKLESAQKAFAAREASITASDRQAALDVAKQANAAREQAAKAESLMARVSAEREQLQNEKLAIEKRRAEAELAATQAHNAAAQAQNAALQAQKIALAAEKAARVAESKDREVAVRAAETEKNQQELARREEALLATQKALSEREKALAATASNQQNEGAALRDEVARLRTELALASQRAKAAAMPAPRPAPVPVPVSVSAPVPVAVATPQPRASVEDVPAPRPRSITLRAPSRVSRIDFVDEPARSSVIIDMDEPAQYSLQRSGSRVTLRLHHTNLPASLERSLDARQYFGPVRVISSYRDPSDRAGVVVEVDLAELVPNKVRQDGARIYLDFQKPKHGSAAYSVQRARVQVAGFSTLMLPSLYAQSGSSERTPTNRKRYSGRRIDLDFKGADIHNILRLLADVGGVNIVTSDDVRGEVTIKMRDVPWDHALDVVLRAKSLGQAREGNLIRVAPMAVLEKELEAEIARKKQQVEVAPTETRLIGVSYAEASQMQSRAKELLSSRGKISVDERTNNLIVSDVAENLGLVEELVRNLDSQTSQVVIEARIVEARSTFTRQLGVQWGGSGFMDAEHGNPTGLVFPNALGVGGGATDTNAPLAGLVPAPRSGGTGASSPDFAVNMPAPVGTGVGGALGLTLGSVAGAFNLNLRLSAMESTGQVRILSSPRISTMDNVQASIEQGVAIPISVVSAAGVQTVFVDAKLNLSVKPHVTNEGTVVLDVQVTRNEPDFANTGARGDPTILKKEAKTQMLVRDGDTAVIGGIYQRNSGVSYAKVPFFAEIPVLGLLFRSRRENDDRTEFLVFITPRVVNRSRASAR
jgi:type IV pilus assembly protein PilQ